MDLLSTDSALLAPYNWTIPAELQVSRCGDSPAIWCPKPPAAPLCAAPHRAGRRRCSYTSTALLCLRHMQNPAGANLLADAITANLQLWQYSAGGATRYSFWQVHVQAS